MDTQKDINITPHQNGVQFVQNVIWRDENEEPLIDDRTRLECGGVPQATYELQSQMTKLCTFHHGHGLNIRLLEDGNVALRVNSHDNGIVFSQ